MCKSCTKLAGQSRGRFSGKSCTTRIAGGLRKAPQRSRGENIVLVLSKAVLVLEPNLAARSVIINIHGLLFLLHAMVPVDYEYEHEHEQYHYGTVELCQSPGKAGGFLGKINTTTGNTEMHPVPRFQNASSAKLIILMTMAVALPPVLWPSEGYCRSGPFHDVRQYGAAGNGQTLDTDAIQAAVDACAEAEGGSVYFPAGRYLSGTIRLRSHVTLHLATGAVLLGSTHLDDYPILQPALASWTDRYCCRALIWGEDLEDIAIVGRGTIDGQGAHFRGNQPSGPELEKILESWDSTTRYRPKPRYVNRPYVIRLITCRDIRVEGITLRNSPMWMQHYLNCDALVVRGITVYNHCGENNDMIDIDGCHDVVISDCYGDTDDDALTFKSTTDRLTENVVVTNCVLSSHVNTIKMGTESHGGFRNIAISNCVIRPSRDRDAMAGQNEGFAGIALEMVDGGTLDGVTISNITMTGQTVPIFLRLGDRGRSYRKGVPRPPAGTLRNVAINNVVATGVGKVGCSITGLPGHRVEHVSIANVRIDFAGGETAQVAPADVPEQPDKYPDCTMFGTLPAYGFYVRHVEGLVLRDIDLTYAQADARPALVCDDVHDLVVDHLNAQVQPETTAQIYLKDTRGALLRGCRPPTTKVFLRLAGTSDRILVVGNDLANVRTPFTFAGTTPQSAVDAKANRLPSARQE